MEHVLDNPIWNALVTGNAELAEGEGDVKCFPADVSPFVGLKEINPGNLARLYQRVNEERVVAIKASAVMEIPAVWKVIARVQAFQMVYTSTTSTTSSAEAEPTSSASQAQPTLIPLGDLHVPAMMALTALTNPGPFYQRTILFGNYSGIFDGDELVAMAGFRMHPGDYIEISAVCTRPGYNGRGYARALIIHLIDLIRSKNSTPFLHVVTTNERAIDVYRKLGFVTRQEMTIVFMRKNMSAVNGAS
jgi:predicted GNAT family acetyltransferase